MSLEEIDHYLRIDDRLSTSGQPTAEQVPEIVEDGCLTLINLITPDSKNAIPNEGEIASELGLTYVHIPVVWSEPKRSDWDQYCALLNTSDRKTHTHCVVNMRVSAFTFLYRVAHQDADPAEAKALMEEIWTPNGVWEEFVDEILRDHDVDYFSI
tara:strand:- start:313 stop:777 length:465 start_codon:yes stop_codon:yes gene_type:complete